MAGSKNQAIRLNLLLKTLKQSWIAIIQLRVDRALMEPALLRSTVYCRRCCTITGIR